MWAGTGYDNGRSFNPLMKTITASVPVLVLCTAAFAAPPTPPRTESIFPLSGQQGSTFEATIRGTGLAGAYEVWFEKPGASAKVLGVEQEAAMPGSKRKPGDLLRIEVRLDRDSEASRSFRVLTPGGVSNALQVFGYPEPSQVEAPAPHDLPRQAQPLSSIPVAVQGRIADVGEVDYYSFRVAAGEELTFRTSSSEALDPGLALYRLTGS